MGTGSLKRRESPALLEYKPSLRRHNLRLSIGTIWKVKDRREMNLRALAQKHDRACFLGEPAKRSVATRVFFVKEGFRKPNMLKV
jgi:hypothetical protein